MIFNTAIPQNDFNLDEHPYIAGFNAQIYNGGPHVYYRENSTTTMDPLKDVLNHIIKRSDLAVVAAALDESEDIVIVAWTNGTFNSVVRTQASVRSV